MIRTFSMKPVVALVAAMIALASPVARAAEAESKRLIQARDYISDERWIQAVDLLRAVVDDPKETRRDEALYWLAHSQHQAGDSAAAIATIKRLEQDFPRSMWVRPAQSLSLDIAVKLGRTDVLWWMANPRPAIAPSPKAVAPDGAPAPGPAKMRPAPLPAPKAIPPSAVWSVSTIEPDADLRIQALGSLMRTEADRAIPMLAEIAFEVDKPGPASRAVAVLARSPSPKAKETVVQVAKTGPEPVRITAVRELARFRGRSVSDDLMQVYVTADEPLKFQIVQSLGDIEAPMPLLRIVETEKEPKVRYVALNNLGRAGAVPQLAAMYKTMKTFEAKQSIIVGLFNARADEELIVIADVERTRSPRLRNEVIQRLRLLQTPKAVEYVKRVSLQNPPEKR
jgi:hypothetical protein